MVLLVLCVVGGVGASFVKRAARGAFACILANARLAWLSIEVLTGFMIMTGG